MWCRHVDDKKWKLTHHKLCLHYCDWRLMMPDVRKRHGAVVKARLMRGQTILRNAQGAARSFVWAAKCLFCFLGSSQWRNCCLVEVEVDMRRINHEFGLTTNVLRSSYRRPSGCLPCRTHNHHPQSAALGQSAGWDAFPAPTEGAGQGGERDLREPTCSLRTGTTRQTLLV